MSRFDDTIAAFDAKSAGDPNKIAVDGQEQPAGLVYAQRMTAWLGRVEPDASEELRLAVHAQHICRWAMPRTDYPTGRAGYKQWRRELAVHHAEVAAGIMAEQGYGHDAIERVGDLLQKKRLGTDPETQSLEDVACLVFLEFYFPDFAADHDDDKVVSILRKTWKKMSERGHELALSMEYADAQRVLIERALGG